MQELHFDVVSEQIKDSDVVLEYVVSVYQGIVASAFLWPHRRQHLAPVPWRENRLNPEMVLNHQAGLVLWGEALDHIFQSLPYRCQAAFPLPWESKASRAAIRRSSSTPSAILRSTWRM